MENANEGCCFASLDADGSTIVVKLRTASAAGIGEAVVRYPLDHKFYANVRDHVGVLQRGKWKAVPPWPDVP